MSDDFLGFMLVLLLTLLIAIAANVLYLAAFSNAVEVSEWCINHNMRATYSESYCAYSNCTKNVAGGEHCENELYKIPEENKT